MKVDGAKLLSDLPLKLSVMPPVELVSTDDAPPAEIVERVFAEATRLLKSGERSPFHDKYRDALQESPDIVMAHAEVSKLLTGR